MAAGADAGQQELAGMPAPLYPCTPTRLTTWLDCPRRYRFSYLDRPQPQKGPPWAHNSVGAAVHSALADWWSLPLRERTAQSAGGLLRRRWLKDGFRDGAQSARAGERAVGWMTAYLDGVDPADEPVGIERTVSTPTRTLVLSGRVDRIDDRPPGHRDPVRRHGVTPTDDAARPDDAAQLEDSVRSEDSVRPDGEGQDLASDPGGLVIVDYKTGRYVPAADDARSSLALGVYAIAAARTFRRACLQVELHHLPSGIRAVARYTPAGLARKVAEAESIGRESAAADSAFRRGDTGDATFPPSPSRMCSWCDFRRHCLEGQAAAPSREPWSSLPD